MFQLLFNLTLFFSFRTAFPALHPSLLLSVSLLPLNSCITLTENPNILPTLRLELPLPSKSPLFKGGVSFIPAFERISLTLK